MPYEKASTYLDQARSWGVLDCICRVQKRLIGQGCNHTVKNCLVFSPKPGAFQKSEEIETISHEKALEILAEADREGLVHSINNAQTEVYYVCNCCTCSCGVLRGMVEYGSENSIARSDFYAVADQDVCSGCEICLERCAFEAISMEDGLCQVERSRCYADSASVPVIPAPCHWSRKVLKSWPRRRQMTMHGGGSGPHPGIRHHL